MLKKFWKQYGKIVSATVFLTVAGLCYGFAGSREDGIILNENGHPIEQQEILNELPWNDSETLERQENSTEKAELEETEPEIPMCYVHICGEVNSPGVYELPEGSRIFEALEAAGGFTVEAAESSLNLAGVISDGMQIVILSKEEEQAALAEQKDAASGLVNINHASKEQLMKLPGIGESRAEDIIRYREDAGGFQTIEDIMKVSGIKNAAFQKIKDSITV